MTKHFFVEKDLTFIGHKITNRNQKAITSKRSKDCRSIVTSRPSIVEFNIITKCLAGCIMCNYTKEGEILPLERFKRMADELLPKAEQVLLIGGEVMMHPDFYEICEYTHRFDVRTKICTNLYTIVGRRAEAIERFLDAVTVSIDGATKCIYESVRSQLSFDRLVENLYSLAAMKSRNPNLELIWRFVAMRRNIQDLPAAVEMAHKFGFSRMHVNFLVVRGSLALDESLLFHRDIANRCFDQARKRAEDLGIVLKIVRNFDLKSRPYLKSNPPTHAHNFCTHPWERARVATNGDVAACCQLQKVPMGNMFKDSFEHIWNGLSYQNLREALKTCSPEMPERCRSCRSALTKEQSDSNNALLHIERKRFPEFQEKLQQVFQNE